MSNLFSTGGAGNVGASEGIDQQSLKFNDDESQYLSWTPAAAGNRKTFTLSMWFKLGNLPTSDHYLFGTGVSGSATQSWIYFNSSNSNKLTFGIRVSSSNYQITIDPLYRDPSAWYHLVYSVDTTQSTAADRVKIYVNGSQVTDFVSSSYPPQNSDTSISDAVPQVLGANNAGSGSYFDGYMSDINFIDGQALDASSFGQFTNGYWEKKDYSGSYGTNGFHLTFQDDVVSEGFNTVTYRGTGATQSISGLGFEPDLVWLKSRNAARSHGLFDAVRGRAKGFAVETTNSEYSSSTGRDLVSFDADGFTVGNPENFGSTNTSGDSIVAWAWDAGSGSPVSNTDGSITSTVKANPSYGFSIVSYVGNYSSATIGHGLSSAPKMILLKNRTQTADWVVYHSALNITGSEYLRLNQTNSVYSSSTVWNDTETTSSVFSTGANGLTNNSGESYIAYCFHSVAGYSSIGSYSGTGASGNAVTGLGFKPAFLMVKLATGGTGSWILWDNTRDTNDADVDNPLFPHSSSAEFTSGGTYDIQFDSDGFTINNSSPNHNGSGGTYIYMAFADTREAAFWKDVSGQGNHWTPSGLDYRDSLIDSPANNFNTTNVLSKGSYVTHSNGNLTVTGNTSSNNGNYLAFPRLTSGKYYYEQYINIVSLYPYFIFNVSSDTFYFSNGGTGWPAASNVRISGASAGGYTGLGASTGDIIGIAVDLDSGTRTVKIYKNNSLLETINITTPDAGIGMAEYNGSFSVYNFGQDSTFAGNRPAGGNTDANNIGDFAYPVPSGGYLALCTANLPKPSIIDGSEHFNTIIWTGVDTASGRDFTGVGFQPDLVWSAVRSVAYGHRIYDSVRGFGVNKVLSSASTSAESSSSTYGYMDSSLPDGFSTTAGSIDNDLFNGIGKTYVAWNWKAGGSAVSNTDGSITSQVSANVDAGFSVLTYSPSGSSGSVGHGLGVTPSVVIVKRRDTTGQWVSHWTAISGANKQLYLNGTNAVDTNNISSLTSTTFTVSGWSEVATAGGSYVAYCFADVDGFSKAGSYTGNGSADGPFIYTGFRPAWIMIKNIASGENWQIHDSGRDPDNVVTQRLYANTNGADVTSTFMDFVSNGVKCRNFSGGFNSSGATFIYLAFAETPFKYANAR